MSSQGSPQSREMDGETHNVSFGGFYLWKPQCVSKLRTFASLVMTREANMSFVNARAMDDIEHIMKFKKANDPKFLVMGNCIENTRIHVYYSETDVHLEKMIKEKKLHIDSRIFSLKQSMEMFLENRNILSSDDNAIWEKNAMWDENADLLPRDVLSFGSPLKLICDQSRDPVYFYRDSRMRVVADQPFDAFDVVTILGVNGSDECRPVFSEDHDMHLLCNMDGLTAEESLFLKIGSDLFCHDVYGHAADGLMTHPMHKIPEEFEAFLFTVGEVKKGQSLSDFEKGCGTDHFIRTESHVKLLGETGEANCTIIYVMVYGIAFPIVITTRDIQKGDELIFSENPYRKIKEETLFEISKLLNTTKVSRKSVGTQTTQDQEDVQKMVTTIVKESVGACMEQVFQHFEVGPSRKRARE